MNDKLIDVWDLATFDAALIATLAAEIDTIRDYMVRDREIFLAHDLGRARSIRRPGNAHAGAFMGLNERVGAEMQARTIRAWHYTRLTDAEADALRTAGVELSTLGSLKARLSARVIAGDFSQAVADALFAASPFHNDPFELRLNKLWMTSHPVVIDDPGVAPLMAHWGGEVASFSLTDPRYLATLASIGQRSVVELAVPLALTKAAYWASAAVIATFGRSLGCVPEKRQFDLCVQSPLPGSAVLAIHTDADPTFGAMAVTYPPGFIDVCIGRWKELTGEDN